MTAAAAAATSKGGQGLFDGLTSPPHVLDVTTACLRFLADVELQLLLQQQQQQQQQQHTEVPPVFVLSEWLKYANRQQQQQQQLPEGWEMLSLPAGSSSSRCTQAARLALRVLECVCGLCSETLSSRPFHITAQRCFVMVVLARLRHGLVYLQHAVSAGAGAAAADTVGVLQQWLHNEVLPGSSAAVGAVFAGLIEQL
jgi:hypothetical protein